MRELQHNTQDYLHRALELIDSLLSQRKFDQAIQFFADNELELLGKDSRHSALLRHRHARALSAVSQLPQALKTARRAEVELTRFGETIDLARVYLTLGGVLRDMGELTESERSFRDAESIFRRCDDSVGRGEAVNRLAQLKFMQSELPQAITLLVEALELARERDDLRRMAFLYGNLGRVQSFAGASAKAIENLQMNIKLSSELGDAVEVVKARLSLGYEFVRLGRFADAAAEFDELGAPIAENSLHREEALWLIYRAELAVKRGQFALATETLSEAYRLAQRISPTGDLTARVTRGLAELALAEGSFARALKFAGDAEERFRELGEKIDLGVILHVQAQANHGLSKRAEAVELFERSLDLLDGARAAYELAAALEWAGRVDLFSTHKRLAYLFRAQELQIRRGDEKSRERIDRYIASDAGFELKPSTTDSAGAVAKASESAAPTVVTASPQMQRILSQLRLIRTTDLPILLTGETGVGKGHIARYYHALVCPDRPFIAINVTNVPETLLESELFGHTKGAYTDATSSATGLLEAANGGVLFLDEIGEMPLKLQMRLLSVIEDKRFRPVGSTEEIDVDFILVTATNRDLKRMVDQREFRRDLYHRLDGITFEIPALRDRKEDIPLLLEYYLRRSGLLAEDQGAEPELARRFLAHSWPGNVRELENAVKRMKALSALVKEGSLAELVPSIFEADLQVETADLFSRVERFERELILEALIAANWNKSAAARSLDVHESTLRAKMKRYGLERPDEDADLSVRSA